MLYFDDQVCIPWKTHQQNKKIIKQTNKQKHLKQNEQKIWTKTTSLKPSL